MNWKSCMMAFAAFSLLLSGLAAADISSSSSEADYFAKYGSKSSFIPVALPGTGIQAAGSPTYVYRAAISCGSGSVASKERIDLVNGYQNYACGSRYAEQCILDGTPDTYWDEYCDYGARDGIAPYSQQGNSQFGACIDTSTQNRMTNCADFCGSQGKTCQNYGCMHPVETNSRFGAIFYPNSVCAGEPSKNFQCGDSFISGASVKCCCEGYTVPTVTNRAPVVSGVSGPSILNAGASGTWAVAASDPENGPLSYSVVWGDEGSAGVQALTVASLQTSSFTHIYYSAGTYNPTFTITDEKGLTAKTSMSVRVGSQGTAASYCNEDDAGARFEAKSTTTWRDSSGNTIGTYTDTCNGNTLTEYHCNNNYRTQSSESVGLSTQYYCQYGCSNGACIKPSSLSAKYCARSTTISEGGSGSAEFTNIGLDTSSHPEILQYRVQFSDGWSRWFVPGQEDTDWKTADGKQRRVWAYFQDRQHEIVKCLDGTQAKPTEPQQPSGRQVSVYVAGRAIKGSGNAQVSIVEFSEFPGPFDQRVQPTMRQIESNFGNNVNFIHMNLPLPFYPTAEKAAEAVECAGDQGKYWQMHDVIFANVQTDDNTLQTDASAIGLDANQFSTCLTGGSKATAVSAQMAEAQRVGISGTPIFVIGTRNGNYVTGEVVEGAQAYEVFAAALSRATGNWPSNKAPVISGASGPTSIGVGESATWSVRASDPENGYLSYSVVWGDEGSTGQYAAQNAVASQTSTFTHTYYNAGTYTPTFTVTDDKGVSATTSITVNVGAANSNAVSLNVNAEPTDIHVHDNVKITSKITYTPSTGSTISQQFKVVTSFYGANAGFSGKEGKKEKSNEGEANAEGKGNDKDEENGNGNKGSSGKTYYLEGSDNTVISAAATAAIDASAEQRTDYITIAPGESATVSAYFSAKSAGTKYATVNVYQRVSGDYRLVSTQQLKLTVGGPATGTTNLHLSPGWNMVSVPTASGKVSMDEVASQCDAKPTAWRLASTGYVKESTLAAGYGYWVRAGKECNVKVTNSGSAQITPAPLFAGWNLIGAPESEVAISNYLGTCQVNGGPWYYASTIGGHSYVFSSTLSPGKAYWLNVKAACQLGYGDDSPPSPPS